MRSKLISYLIVAFCSIIYGSYTFAQDDDTVRYSIQAVLKVRHPTDNADWWRALGPTAPLTIISLYGEDKNIYHQIRLLAALAWFNLPEATQLLKQEAQSNSNSVIQNTALRALATSQGEREEDFLNQAIKSDDPQKRLAVANGLAASESPRSQTIIRSMLKNEQTEWVAVKIRKNLKGAHRTNAQFLHKFTRPVDGR
jgi:HEAT repeat protein